MNRSVPLLVVCCALTMRTALSQLTFQKRVPYFGMHSCLIHQQCTPIRQCFAFRTVADIRRHRPKPCGFVGSQPLVCCPSPSGTSSSSASGSPTRPTAQTTPLTTIAVPIGPPTVPATTSTTSPATTLATTPATSPATTSTTTPATASASTPGPDFEALRRLLPEKCGNPTRKIHDMFPALPPPGQPGLAGPPGFDPGRGKFGPGRSEFGRPGIGGKQAREGKWPWMVLLGKWEGSRLGGWFCGGTLITQRHVLTAAHCLRPQQLGSVGARVGEHDLRTTQDVEHQDRNISRITRHARYVGSQNDLALVTLAEPVLPSRYIQPICLPDPDAEYTGRDVEVAGFGALSFAGRRPQVLVEVPLRVFNATVCEESYRRVPQYASKFPGGFQGTKICAGSRDDKPRDACPGDSGGPLMVWDRVVGKQVLIGVVSTGIGCGNPEFPGIYTKVSAYIEWILMNL